jgi:hypothetical protein
MESMNYDMVIRRMAAPTEGFALGERPAKHQLIKPAYKKLAAAIVKNTAYLEAGKAMLDMAQREDRHAREESLRVPGNKSVSGIDDISWFNEEQEQGGLVDLFSLSPPEALWHTGPYLVGQLPSRRLRVMLGDRDWVLRTRFGFTICPLPRPGAPATLFLTFEGIPAKADADRKNRPDLAQLAQLLAMTVEMEKKALPFLHRAYREALTEITGKTVDAGLGKRRLHVTLAESLDYATDALLDRLRFTKATPESILKIGDDATAREKYARQALIELEQLIPAPSRSFQAGKREVSVSINEPRGTQTEAVLHRSEMQPGITEIAGLVSTEHHRTPYDHLKQIIESRRGEKEEPRLRASCEAKPLSAHLIKQGVYAWAVRPKTAGRSRPSAPHAGLITPG